jgi:hypothetical protein
MTFRATAASVIVATVLAKAPTAYAQAPAQLNDHVLPIAASALVGAAASFFLLPLIVPATTAAATAGASATAGPMIAMIGAGIGGLIGYEVSH